MIDYVSIELPCLPDKFLSNRKLHFVSEINPTTGEIKINSHGYRKSTAYLSESLQIEINFNDKKQLFNIFLRGSLHKHCHNNNNNTQFNFFELQKCIIELCQLLEISPQDCQIRHFEFGVNIQPCQIADSVLKSIISCKGKEYQLKEFNGQGHFRKFEFTHYAIKVYDKGRQYLSKENLLRIEIKVLKLQYLQKKGHKISNLYDLLQYENIQGLEKCLIDTIENFYFFDYRIDLNKIPVRERTILTEGKNSAFWNEYKQTHSAKGYQKKVNRFKELVRKYAPGNLQNEIKELTSLTWCNLLNSYPLLPLSKGPIVTQNYPYIVGNNNPLPLRYCLTCGREITNQKTNSKFCSEKIFGREVKKCRNTISNFKRNEKRKYPAQTIFDIDSLLNLELRRIKTLAFKIEV